MLTNEFFMGTQLYQKKLVDLCKPMANYMGITHAIYVDIDKEGKMFTVCTHDKWMERIIEKRYYKLDPLMVHPSNIDNGFAFDEGVQDLEFKNRLIKDAAEQCNWYHGFSYIEKDAAGGYCGINFGTREDNLQIINQVMNEPHKIKKYIRALKKNLSGIASDLKNKRIDLAALKGDAFYTQKGIVYHDRLSKEKRIRFLKEASILSPQDEALLTRDSLSLEEAACMRLYLTESSIKKVAQSLTWSIAVVSRHIQNLKKKLGCKSKEELLEKGTILESLGYF